MQLSGEPLPPFLGGFQENSMRKTFLAIVAGLLLVPAARAPAPGDVTTPIKQFIDGFNAGDVKTAYAAYAPGTITIIDEFAPHRWVGPHAAQEWASDYDKHATATGVTDGVVKYGAPTRSVVDGDTAYVIIPALYTYKEHGKPMSEEGQMTFVLHTETTGWKIQGWTWTGVVPYSPK
jgi:ketosteroid isomerase-like protein